MPKDEGPCMSMRRAVFIALFTTGAAAMIYEVVLLRELAIVLGATETAAGIILSSFMAGLAIGSKAFGGYSERVEDPTGLFIRMELAIAACALYLLPLARMLPQVHDWTIEVFIAVAALLPPTILMGGELPVAGRLLAEEDRRRGKEERTGEYVGYAYSADTLGGIVGAAATGLVLIPYLGAIKTMMLGAMLNVLSGAVLAVRRTLPRGEVPVVAALPLAILLIVGLQAMDITSIELQLVNRIYEYRVIYTEQTVYQRIDIINHTDFGKSLFLNGQLQMTVEDEPMYHENLIHPAMVAHPLPRRVLIIGGGDGGALREVLKHGPEEVTLVELDERVVSVARNLLPEVNQGAFDDPRVTLLFNDGRYVLKTAVEEGRKWDVIICDLSDPTTGPVALLYTREFYQLVKSALDKDGVFVTQATSPYWYPEAYASITLTLADTFTTAYPMVTWVPTFGMWGYVVASDGPDPSTMSTEDIISRLQERGITTNHYTARAHARLFILPGSVETALALPNVPVSTDDNPFVLQAMQEEDD